MKNFRYMLIAVLALLVSMPAFAQKTGKALKKEVMSSVSELDEKQQLMLLNYARGMVKVDAKKELAKTMKKMSDADRQKLLDYSNKVKMAKAAKPAAPNSRVKATPGMAQKPKAKTKSKTKAKAKAVAPTGPLTQVEVIEATYDFGVINQGEKAQTIYKIKNVGKNPLIISKAKGSCGCTVPKWPKDPIAPGEIAEIDVVFNSRGKKGKQSKRITITANTDPGQTFLTIKGEVKVAPSVIKDVPKPKPSQKQ